MSGNILRGDIPVGLFNGSRLMKLYLLENHIGGGVPSELESLAKLKILNLGDNNLRGKLPASLGNLTSLKRVIFSFNKIEGGIPDALARLTQLVSLGLALNKFSGAFPPSIYNISSLKFLSMFGPIPTTFSTIANLQHLAIVWNKMTEALANCTQLHTLLVNRNRLGSDLPTSITNLSTNLWKLDLGRNFISGTIPYDIGNLISLQKLRLSGELPSSLGNITRLEQLYFSSNSFEGAVPPSLGHCEYILYLWIGSNKLNGTIPQEIMQIQSLVYLNLSDNSLTGSLPKYIKPLERLCKLSVEHNKLSGQLPQVQGDCLSVENLYLQGNFFDGDIPNIKGLMGAKRLDFSNNNLSGSIPGYFANLEYLNLSINSFEGEVPTKGKFQNATVVTVFVNMGLCGGIKELKLKPCIVQAQPMETSYFSLSKKVSIGVSVGVALLLMVFIAYISLHWFIKIKNQQTSNPTSSALEVFHGKISYAYLRNATDGFSSSNLIGSGGFGTVFKAFLPIENKVVAVKVLNLHRRGAMKSFLTECESLKDEMISEYELMPNGSLDMWLHPEKVEEIRRPSRTLTLFERLNIAIDVISVLEYLHVYCHVSDFGIAQLLMKLDQESLFNQLSSAGV
ncbi:hypothetical protein F2Q68_00022244 [Brassica cretica]|uniref:Protein kinase domain-containing protein n=1 Tax=Brassica cretica TaxID=69181 RepID=A0A8S9FWN7_BRACR|nr:hypothetical protein F2Q68_00022244 [Brassica cretica]